VPLGLRLQSVRRAAAPALAALALLAATGCSASSGAAVGTTGSDAGAPGGPGYVSGAGTLTVVPPGERSEPVPVAGETLEGERLDVADLRGDVVVLNFWASWCPPCRAEADNLEAAYEAARDEGVQFVGINVKDKLSSAQAFQRAHSTSYASLYDQPGRLALGFRGVLPPDALPSTLVLDREGRVAVRFLGGVTEAQLSPVVAGVVAEGAPRSTEAEGT
jgi:thiol-disulfide isomerase/thioredoxin